MGRIKRWGKVLAFFSVKKEGDGLLAKTGTCELCGREEVELTIHHLTPKQHGGALLPVAELCRPCHKQIHALYTNQELAVRLQTIERLKDDEKIKKYVKWVQKQDAAKRVKVKKAKERKNRR